MKTMHCIVTGKVQKVWFRAWTQDLAQRMKVKGWVRNLPDGSVELMAQADEKTLQAFLEELRQGPPLSRVEDVQTDYPESTDEFESFEFRWN